MSGGACVCMFVGDGFIINLEQFTLPSAATGLFDILFFHTSTAERMLVVVAVSETACKSNKMLSKCVTSACR